jgi:hypothetical protein
MVIYQQWFHYYKKGEVVTMGKKSYPAKNNNKKKEDNKKRRDEPLSTSIGDLLKAKGFSIPEAEKKDTPVHKKKMHKSITEELKEEYRATGKLLSPEKLSKGFAESQASTKFDMTVKEESVEEPKKVVSREGSWDEFANAFLAEKEEPKPEPETNPTVFHLGKEYITKEGSDAKVRTDEFISKE